MTKVDSLRTEIIEKILCIKDERYLNAIYQIVDSKEHTDKIVKLSSEQRRVLDQSELDIQEGRLTSHESLMNQKRAWLKGK